jgi:hypothetical protein
MTAAAAVVVVMVVVVVVVVVVVKVYSWNAIVCASFVDKTREGKRREDKAQDKARQGKARQKQDRTRQAKGRQRSCLNAQLTHDACLSAVKLSPDAASQLSIQSGLEDPPSSRTLSTSTLSTLSTSTLSTLSTSTLSTLSTSTKRNKPSQGTSAQRSSTAWETVMEEPLSLSFATIHEILGQKVSGTGTGTGRGVSAPISEVALFREELAHMLPLDSLRAVCNGTFWLFVCVVG